MTGPIIALEDVASVDITTSDLAGRYLVDINGQVTLEATLGELECVAFNILALVSGERLTLFRQIGGGS
jgi:hypothetical protein